MRLNELLHFNKITIQSHDNPDADSLASGYALYQFFKDKGKEVQFVYSGRYQIQKSNLLLMIEKLNIPIRYVEKAHIEGLLITVDGQYGSGNVTLLEAQEVAIIDHHQEEVKGYERTEIRSYLGSCSTLVWHLLGFEDYNVNGDVNVATALYYGLYTDTGQFSEIFHPLDKDMRDSLHFDQTVISLLRNSNISLSELEIAGLALLRYIYNEHHRFAVIKVKPCDPNILGLISDFLLQVDSIDTCVVFNEVQDGIKLSVRSCVKEVKACELADYLTNVIGSGGGHNIKAGGFIQRKLFVEQYQNMNLEAYFTEKMNQYFEGFVVIDAANYQFNTQGVKLYRKRRVPIGFVRLAHYIQTGTPVLIRTLEGDIDFFVEKDTYIMIGIAGEVYPIKKEKFHSKYTPIEDHITYQAEYMPSIKNLYDGNTVTVEKYAHACIPNEEEFFYVRSIDIATKLFTLWEPDNYMYGNIGDYIAARRDGLKDLTIIGKDIFERMYEEVEV
ncbi:MAG TPA: DHH family phosphoesterase [Lachnospiraceae bacterium]|nr:DHH family phosphoesterase [Lachnospiraceae bacterium]